MNAAAIMIGLISLGISLLAGRRLINGLQTGQMVFFGSYRDWGPFDRDKQPIRFWLSSAWAAFASSAIVFWPITINEWRV